MAARAVQMELGGAVHELCSDLGAWAAIDDSGGDTFFEVIGRVGGEGAKPKAKDVQLLVWAFLQHETPKPSLADVGRWVTIHNFGEACRKVLEAFADGVPDAESDGPRPTNGGTGAVSDGPPSNLVLSGMPSGA